jgi:hypothetical protein
MKRFALLALLLLCLSSGSGYSQSEDSPGEPDPGQSYLLNLDFNFSIRASGAKGDHPLAVRSAEEVSQAPYKLTIGVTSPQFKLKAGESQKVFTFTPKARKTFTIQTIGNNAWKMELAGPGDPSNVIAVDNSKSGDGANARIVKTLPPGGVYYVTVKPFASFTGRAFRIKVASSEAPPAPEPAPEPEPEPQPEPQPEPAPVPSGDTKIIFIWETTQPLSRQQMLVWYAAEVDEALARHTTPDPDGLPGYRKWDIEADILAEDNTWVLFFVECKRRLTQPGAPVLPVVAIMRNRQVTIHSLPTSVQATVSLIRGQ